MPKESIGKWQSYAWNQPKELKRGEVPTKPLEPKALPESVRAWICDISERMQVPIEFIAVPAIVAASSLIGRQVGIFPKLNDDWMVIPNLWGMVIAKPGWMKSPAFSEALKPLEKIEGHKLKVYREEKKAADEKLMAYKSILAGMYEELKLLSRKGEESSLEQLKHKIALHIQKEPAGTLEPRLKTNDATVEKLAILLLDNPNGILVLRDELAGWLSTLQKAGREGDREFFLESWNGFGSYTVDRLSRDTIHLPALCLSIFGGIQPTKLRDFIVADKFAADGLIQRFQLMVAPELPKNWSNIDRKPNLAAYEKALQAFHNLQNLQSKLPDTLRPKGGLKGYSWDSEAHECFVSWRKELETKLRGDAFPSDAIESHFSKYRSLVPSLALIFNLLDGEGNKELISESYVKQALSWVDTLSSHANKVYSVTVEDHWAEMRQLARKINMGSVKDKDSLRSIYRRHWAGLNTPSKLKGAIALLEKFDWVKIEQIQKHKTKSEIIRINPHLREGFDRMQ